MGVPPGEGVPGGQHENDIEYKYDFWISFTLGFPVLTSLYSQPFEWETTNTRFVWNVTIEA